MILLIGKNKSAFTLIELLLVLLLIGLMLGMSVSAMPRGHKVQLKKFSQQMVLDFQHTQSQAVSNGTTFEVVFNQSNQYVINELTSPIKQVKLRKLPQGLDITSTAESIYFYPDGSSSQVEMKVRLGREELSIGHGLHRFRWIIEYADTQETI